MSTNDTVELDPLDPEAHLPDGGTAIAYVLEWTPAGRDRERREVHLRELGPADDIEVKKATGLSSATDLINTAGPAGILGLWWLGGRQAGKKETYRELVPMFTNALIDAGNPSVRVIVELGDDDVEDELDDPTLGAST